MEKTKEESDIYQHEDGVLKTAMRFFADELLPCFKIEGKVVGFAPTEEVQLELHKMYQDFNLVMEDGSWKHFEFQSTDGGLADLKRFRMYESVASCHYGVEVTTYVLYSGKIKHPVTQITEGVNTYQIVPIIMQNNSADEVIGNLRRKLKNGEIITKADLIPLILTPLMGGKMEQKERITAAFEICGRATEVSENDIRKIEAMVYAMADKFLEQMELEEVKEELKMTRLGAMLVNDGMQLGLERGLENVIKLCKEFGATKEEAVIRITNMFGRDIEIAKEDVEKYWGE